MRLKSSVIYERAYIIFNISNSCADCVYICIFFRNHRPWRFVGIITSITKLICMWLTKSFLFRYIITRATMHIPQHIYGYTHTACITRVCEWASYKYIVVGCGMPKLGKPWTRVNGFFGEYIWVHLKGIYARWSFSLSRILLIHRNMFACWHMSAMLLLTVLIKSCAHFFS